MDKNVRLNQQAMMQVLDDLVRAGLIAGHLVKDGAPGESSLGVSWTEDGTKIIAGYTRAFLAIRKPSKRNIDALHLLLQRTSISFLEDIEGD